MKSYFLLYLLLTVSSVVSANTIKVAVGSSIRPYVMPETHGGVELEIFRESMAFSNNNIELYYIPYKRVADFLRLGRVDAGLTINEYADISGVVYSDNYITYKNVAISLKSNDVDIQTISDMKKYSVMAFQKATKYLGGEYSEMASSNSQYSEVSKQELQLLSLYNNRVDLIVLDINIFKYYLKEMKGKLPSNKDIVVYDVFSPSHFKVGFLSEAYKNNFNLGLKALKDSGRYDEIIRFYTE